MHYSKTLAKWIVYALIIIGSNTIIVTVFDLPVKDLAPEWTILTTVEVLIFALIIKRSEGRDAVFEALELMPDICRAAEGDTSRREQVETKLQRLEQKGVHLTSAVKALWAGQRNATVLTAGLSKSDAALIRQMLLLLGEPQRS